MPFLADRVFDVAIVGGGILGLSVARDCAMRRLSVALFEKDDFGGGATGKLPGILSGEPHWLESDRQRTRATCEEVQVFHRIAPNLVSRIAMLVPVLRSEPRVRLSQLEAFARAYDPFSALKSGRPSLRLSPANALAVEPGLSKDILGAVSWDEWGVDLLRLAMLTGKSASAAGAQLFNRVDVDHIILQEKRVVGLHVRPEGQNPTVVRARAVVNATGAWSPDLVHNSGLPLELRFAKSVYLKFDRRILNWAIACSTRPAQRTPRLFPLDRITYLGPSESPCDGAGQGTPTDTDIDFLLHAGQAYFPALRDYRAIGADSAVRPYPIAQENQPPQTHILVDHARLGAEGFYTLAGGNIAMSRRMAEQATDLICRRLKRREPCRTHLESLPGCVVDMPWLEESQRTGLDPITVKRIMQRHGYKAHSILNAAAATASASRTLCECEQVIAAEVEYSVRKEMAKSAGDVGRRTRLGTGPCRGCRCLDATTAFVGSLLGWDGERVDAECRRARQELGADEAFFGEQARQADYARWLLRSLGEAT